MDISCAVIRDLLPLYHDGVCSEDSCRLVEEHLQNCPACAAELRQYEEEPRKMENCNEAKLIANTAKEWKKNKAAAFFKGAMLVAFAASAACVIAYNAIGSYIAPDGTLVEPFGFIPLTWLFALLGVLFAICFAAVRRLPRR